MRRAVDVAKYSAIQAEDERLIMCGTSYVVKGKVNMGDGLWMVQMEENLSAPALVTGFLFGESGGGAGGGDGDSRGSGADAGVSVQAEQHAKLDAAFLDAQAATEVKAAARHKKPKKKAAKREARLRIKAQNAQKAAAAKTHADLQRALTPASQHGWAGEAGQATPSQSPPPGAAFWASGAGSIKCNGWYKQFGTCNGKPDYYKVRTDGSKLEGSSLHRITYGHGFVYLPDDDVVWGGWGWGGVVVADGADSGWGFGYEGIGHCDDGVHLLREWHGHDKDDGGDGYIVPEGAVASYYVISVADQPPVSGWKVKAGTSPSPTINFV
jgi:hypothetical protein